MAEQTLLANTPAELRFSSEKDIEEFVVGLEKYERGEISADVFRGFRLNRGVYGQRQSDVNMIRVKIPHGIITAEALIACADVADQYSRGFGHVTTRQNIQFHFVKLTESPAALSRLDKAGLTTKEACGNTVRNVVGCAHAGLLPEEPFDTTPYGHALTRYFIRNPICQALPRKFKVTFSSCNDDCVKGAINDVAAYARVQNGVHGFKLLAGGGLSTQPMAALLVEDFCPADELLAATEALIRLFDREGNRQNKAKARLKYVRKKFGDAKFLEMYKEERAKIRADGREKQPIEAAVEAVPLLTPKIVAPVPHTDAAGYAAFQKSNIKAQRQAGYHMVTIRLHLGDITSSQMRSLASICETYGEGTVRATIDQNLTLRFIPTDNLVPLYYALREVGLAEAGAGSIEDVTSCPGAESCNLAVTASRQLAKTISDALGKNAGTPAVNAAKDLEIKISGCPNSCGQHHIAGIGFHGGLKKVGARPAPIYQLHLGGMVKEGHASFGRELSKIPARRVPDAVLRLLALYEKERNDGEKANAFFARVDEAKVKTLLVDLAAMEDGSMNEVDFSDLGEEAPFRAQAGEGECAA
jgi:sulfite reductase (ferredoxin)